MEDRETVVTEVGGTDYLFNWKDTGWPHEKLRKLVDQFDSNGAVEESWSCSAHRKVRAGDRAYLLKQGKPLGIFGRGFIVSEAVKRDANSWEVPIKFSASRGDALWDPLQRLLVHEEHLLHMPASERFKNIQKSGETLNSEAARQIDSLIDDIIVDDLIPKGSQSLPTNAAGREVVRRKRLIELAMRPDQAAFGEMIRRNYRRKCALTGCVTSAALEAAHIRTQPGVDDNSPANGILLRADIHALLDALLITFTEDGKGVELSPELADEGYAFLREAAITQPSQGPPSLGNIRTHRIRFLARQKQISAYAVIS